MPIDFLLITRSILRTLRNRTTAYRQKKYLKMLNAIKQTENVTVNDIERMYIK